MISPLVRPAPRAQIGFSIPRPAHTHTSLPRPRLAPAQQVGAEGIAGLKAAADALDKALSKHRPTELSSSGQQAQDLQGDVEDLLMVAVSLVKTVYAEDTVTVTCLLEASRHCFAEAVPDTMQVATE